MNTRLLSVVLFSVAFPAIGATFDERLALAKEIERQDATRGYIYGEMFPNLGPRMADAMKACLAINGASLEKFTLVADVSQSGNLENIEFEPKLNTASCFATHIRQTVVPPPPTCNCGALPIVIEMRVAP